MKKHVFSINDIEIVEVTPAMAKEWLDKCNNKNRKLTPRHVRRIVLQMQKGQWLFNGDTICFDWNGTLLDGQHRLQGIYESGKTIKCIIVRNLDPQVIMTKDMEAKPRNLKDVLTMDHVKDASNVAAVVSRFVGIRDGQCIIAGGNEMSSPLDKRNSESTIWDKYDLYYEYKEHFDNYTAVSYRYYNKRRSFLNKSEIGAIFAYLVVVKKHNEEVVNSFFSQLYFGNEECPAIESLRDKLNKDSDRGSVMLGSHKQALIIKTWNYYITGSKVKNVTYDKNKEGSITFK